MVTSPQASPSSLRFRLREVTAEAHRKVEAAMALTDRCIDRASYRSLVTDLWGLYAPLEARLAAMPMDGLGVDLGRLVKTPWLQADLLALGLSKGDIEALPCALNLPTVHCAADCFGVLYVLEGASLGGEIIFRQIKQTLGLTETSGARFFAGYGAQIGERWRSFVYAMSAYGETECRAKSMERAALATFDAFSVWMTERTLLSREGVGHVT